MTDTKHNCRSHGWLDTLAISMSMICAVHCLLTPVMIVLLPVLTATFWVHQDFHIWMILFVVPTTSAAIFIGCRKHKDKFVLALSVLGLALLVSITVYETISHANLVAEAHCSQCVARSQGNPLALTTIVNVLGGILLASAHVRNYLLCRKSRCTHNH